MGKVIQSYYGGQARARFGRGGAATFDKYYPATGELIAKVELATEDMLDECVLMAAEAQKAWARRSVQERGQILIRCAHALMDANEELARL